MSKSEPVEMTRQQLYEQVWSKPVVQLATEYGLSGVGFAKLCRRHNVPLPYRGYWARKAAGQTPRPIGLLLLGKGISDTIRLYPTSDKSESPPDPDVASALAQEAQHAAQDHVPDDLRGAHPLIAKARAELKGDKPDDYGRIGHGRRDPC